MGTRNSATCSTNPPSPDPEFRLVNDAPPTGQTQSANTTAAALAFGTGDGGVPASCDNPELLARRSASPITNFLCVQYVDAFNNFAFRTISVRYALAQPLAPVGLVITPGNRHLRVDWSKGDAADTIATYDVHVVPVDADGGVPATGNPSQSGVTATNADVTRTDDGAPLQNDAGYSVTILAKDTYGNVSAPSDAAVGFPVPSEDFYEHYRNSGGSADGGGGCASGGTPAAVAVLALALALFFRRSRKASGGAALVAALAFGGAAARADDEDRPAPHFLVGFKIDRYDPKVDTEAGLVGTPYHDVFGPRAPLRRRTARRSTSFRSD
jgi:MYXO-CTERM domain-containing protein